MESKKNKSRTYLVPLLDTIIPINKSLLINTYLYDFNYPEYNLTNITGLFVHLSWSESDVHKQYEQDILNSKNLKLHYEVDTNSYMVFLEFNKHQLEDVNNIINGHYSKINNENKKLMLKYWLVGMGSDLYGILYKTKARKAKIEEEYDILLGDDAELSSIFNLNDEVFNNTSKKVKTI